MELKDIQNIIKFVARSGVNKVKLKMKDFEITIMTENGNPKASFQDINPDSVTIAPTNFSENLQKEASSKELELENDSKYVIIKSPMIGTFYRKSSPEKPSLVEVGDFVKENAIVCIIEAMKLFNEIETEISGKIVKILVEDSAPVEFGQPLFLIDPS